MVADLGDLVAPLIGAGPGEVVFQPNVTLAHAVVLAASTSATAAPRIVTDAMHFPSILYLIDEQRPEGAEVDGGALGGRNRASTPQRLIDAIDERTAVVSISHVLFKSAYVHDVAAIAERAREVGAVTVIDGYQSVGTIPVDVRALGVDVYIGGCLKWLCGGPGAAFLWVDPGLRARLRPAADRLDVPPATLRLRAPIWPGATTPGGSSTARRTSRPFMRPGRASRSSAASASPAIREKSLRQTARLLELADARRLSVHHAARPGPARRDRRHRRRARLRDLPEPQGPGHPLRLPPRRGHPPLAPLLHPRRGARRRRRGHRGDPGDRRLAGLHGRASRRHLTAARTRDPARPRLRNGRVLPVRGPRRPAFDQGVVALTSRARLR